jgi:hypothetical protein
MRCNGVNECCNESCTLPATVYSSVHCYCTVICHQSSSGAQQLILILLLVLLLPRFVYQYHTTYGKMQELIVCTVPIWQINAILIMDAYKNIHVE